ncbi:hypothetical protein DPMN_060136 [Dreissena polymorpha]|uniref:Uncharacterized protein n=1 Tax=Dreissena polymorpha TaxID=45954 RepID=A0A9D4C4S3_DREPO|nr:hypothetical protein DPMN_059986 [Dreissena polymorpha]KAH3717351.1 hypothetical protein DPMN_060136 [Dreissena polymorpha]
MVLLIRTSAVLMPSLDRVAHKYLKLVTSSSFSPFMVMFADWHRPRLSAYHLQAEAEAKEQEHLEEPSH